MAMATKTFRDHAHQRSDGRLSHDHGEKLLLRVGFLSVIMAESDFRQPPMHDRGELWHPAWVAFSAGPSAANTNRDGVQRTSSFSPPVLASVPVGVAGRSASGRSLRSLLARPERTHAVVSRCAAQLHLGRDLAALVDQGLVRVSAAVPASSSSSFPGRPRLPTTPIEVRCAWSGCGSGSEASGGPTPIRVEASPTFTPTARVGLARGVVGVAGCFRDQTVVAVLVRAWRVSAGAALAVPLSGGRCGRPFPRVPGLPGRRLPLGLLGSRGDRRRYWRRLGGPSPGPAGPSRAGGEGRRQSGASTSGSCAAARASACGKVRASGSGGVGGRSTAVQGSFGADCWPAGHVLR